MIFSLDMGFFCFIWGSGDFIETLGFFEAVSILPPKCRQQRLGWSYCAASPKLGRNEVKTKDKP